MDSLTQIALGAAVGEAVAGRQVGWRAAAWGAALGTLPDLDILAYPFLDPVGQLAFHRGLTHSAAFAVFTAPVIGAALKKIHKKRPASTRRWALLSFLVIGTHILLDCFTVYGTQVFQPFSDYPVAFSSIFIIDPLYTVPILLGTGLALFLRRRARLWANWGGLTLSTAYLIWAVMAKSVIGGMLNDGLAQAGIQAERTMSTAAPFNTWVWIGMAEAQDTLWATTISLGDSGPPTTFQATPLNKGLVEGHREDRALHRLLRFSKGWMSFEEQEGTLKASDWRFGRTDAWLTDSGDAVFQFELKEDDEGKYHTFVQRPPEVSALPEAFNLLRERMSGR